VLLDRRGVARRQCPKRSRAARVAAGAGGGSARRHASVSGLEAAKAALYGPFLGCVSGTQEGAMGVHYVNGGYAGDSIIDVEKPEALM
jgi:hypothetical protein